MISRLIDRFQRQGSVTDLPRSGGTSLILHLEHAVERASLCAVANLKDIIFGV